LAVALLCLALGDRIGLFWSALYGAASVVMPSALLARGMARLRGSGPAAAAVGFMVWEGVKVVLTVALLVAAVRVVPDLSWPALLAALTVCLSMNWLALLWQGRRKNKSR
jgi:ATP synthase protein I